MGRKAKKQGEDKNDSKTLREISEQREQFIVDNLPLIYFFSRKLNRFGIPIEDMVQIGFEGMLKAIRDYDGKHKFSTYLKYKFIGELSRARKESYYPGPFCLPIYFWTISRKAKHYVEDFEKKCGRSPDLEEIAKSLNIYESRLKSILQFTRPGITIFSEPASREGSETIGDFVSDSTPFDQEKLTILCAWSKKFIFELKKRLPVATRKRAIIVSRIGFVDVDGGGKKIPLEHIGRSFQISKERVRQIEKHFAQEIHCEMNLEKEYGVQKKKASQWIRDIVLLIRELNKKCGWEIDFEYLI